MLDLGLEELKSLSKKDRMVERYMEEVKRVNEDPRFREYMTKEEDQKKILKSLITEATAEGEKIGEAKGKKAGEKQSKIEMAKKMIGKYPVEEIHELTGLAIEEIEKIQNSEENY